MKILVLNGPNINMTGLREPEYYGSKRYDEIMNEVKLDGESRGHSMLFFQSNHEGDLIDWFQKCFFEDIDGIIYNPGAHVHYSYAIKDAITTSTKPTIEVHFSNIYARASSGELYRKESVIAPACIGYIAGLGAIGYHLAIQGLENYIKNHPSKK